MRSLALICPVIWIGIVSGCMSDQQYHAYVQQNQQKLAAAFPAGTKREEIQKKFGATTWSHVRPLESGDPWAYRRFMQSVASTEEKTGKKVHRYDTYLGAPAE